MHTVPSAQGLPLLTQESVRLVAGLGAVAEQAVVRAVNRRAGLAAIYGIADLIAITELTVVTDRVVGGVVTVIRNLITGINGAVYSVIAVNRRSGQAGSGIAGFHTIAVYAVVAVGINEALDSIAEIRFLVAYRTLGTGITAA